jgi:hypothetical protein
MNCRETPGIAFRNKNVREKSKIGKLKRIGIQNKINDYSDGGKVM